MSLLADLAETTMDASRLVSALVKSEVRYQFIYLRIGTMKLLFWASILMVVSLFLIAGLGFLLWGIYVLLAMATGFGLSAFIVGVLCMLLAIVGLIFIRVMIR